MVFFPSVHLPTVMMQLHSIWYFQVAGVWSLSFFQHPVLKSFLPASTEAFYLFSVIALNVNDLYSLFRKRNVLADWSVFSRNLMFFWWNQRILKLYKYTEWLLGRPWNSFLCTQTHLGAGEMHRCHLGRKRTLRIKWIAGLALQEHSLLLCCWKWCSVLLNSVMEYSSQFLPNITILGLLFISSLILIICTTLALKMSTIKFIHSSRFHFTKKYFCT